MQQKIVARYCFIILTFLTMNYFLITIKQVCILFFYIAVGFVLRKTKKFPKNASNIIATLLVYFVGPCYTVLNMTENFSFELLSTYLEMFLIGAGVTAICLLFSIFLSRFFAQKGYQRNVYKYLFAFANVGFFGNPLVEAIFGSQALVQYMIFSLSMTVVLTTYGFIILTDTGIEKTKEEKKKHLIKVFTTPTMICMFLGIILGLCSIKLPPLLKEFITPASKCYSALPMILLGNVLGGFEIKKLFNSKKAYIVAIVKLIVNPIIFSSIAIGLYFLKVNAFTCLLISLLTALPPGMNVVTYPESFGIDSTENAKMLFISYIFAIITIPVIIMFMTSILGIN